MKTPEKKNENARFLPGKKMKMPKKNLTGEKSKTEKSEI
jgi:hypothetical protein